MSNPWEDISLSDYENHMRLDSPYIHAFDRLDEVHCQMEENALISAMEDTGYQMILSDRTGLPNGKALVRLDFRKRG